MLFSYLRIGSSEAEILETTLTAQDLVNAWHYAEHSRTEIDEAIARQEEE